MTGWMSFAALMSLALSACATARPIPVHGATSGYVCHNDGLQRFVGQPATAEVGTDMLRVSGARVLRWLQPGQVVTMEFSAERLTVHLDGNGHIQGASCG